VFGELQFPLRERFSVGPEWHSVAALGRAGRFGVRRGAGLVGLGRRFRRGWFFGFGGHGFLQDFSD
jgi:hypothetical protein